MVVFCYCFVFGQYSSSAILIQHFSLSCLLIQYGAHADVVCITNYVCHFKFDPIYILNQSGEEAYYITNNVRIFFISVDTYQNKMRSTISQNLILAFIFCIEIVLIIQDLTINVWFLKSILCLFQQFDKNHIRWKFLYV